MQVVKHVSSPLEREVPGLGTQRSKQCSLSFYWDKKLVTLTKEVEVRDVESVLVYLNEHTGILHGGFLLHLAHNLRLGVVGEGAEAGGT